MGGGGDGLLVAGLKRTRRALAPGRRRDWRLMPFLAVGLDAVRDVACLPELGEERVLAVTAIIDVEIDPGAARLQHGFLAVHTIHCLSAALARAARFRGSGHNPASSA
jgi:hypothetical protein